ncbi:hypothetical protein D1AOALGA4SA_12539 [Olavius algarvensis Delta 1 endosymbiont]|nr:hypothetical protein D1AOALGA4SA_12539 [Olavius algarvensis Delta 1 endosymbiont]
MTGTEVGKLPGVIQPAVSKVVQRGEKILLGKILGTSVAY